MNLPLHLTTKQLANYHKKIVVASSGCHEWTGVMNNNGYGQFNVSGRKTLAHRIAWELSNGPIPEGMCVLHTCDNPACCNPAHLWIGTQIDNIRDMESKGRARRSGSNHGRSKLTEDDVRKIRELHEKGWRHKSIAVMFGVIQQNISMIVNRKRWKHI